MSDYTNNIVFESELTLQLLRMDSKGKPIIDRAKNKLSNKGDIWEISFWGKKFNFDCFVDYLFSYDLDVFDIKTGVITKIYVCKKDDYRIKDRVVYARKGKIRL